MVNNKTRDPFLSFSSTVIFVIILLIQIFASSAHLAIPALSLPVLPFVPLMLLMMMTIFMVTICHNMQMTIMMTINNLCALPPLPLPIPVLGRAPLFSISTSKMIYHLKSHPRCQPISTFAFLLKHNLTSLHRWQPTPP